MLQYLNFTERNHAVYGRLRSHMKYLLNMCDNKTTSMYLVSDLFGLNTLFMHLT